MDSLLPLGSIIKPYKSDIDYIVIGKKVFSNNEKYDYLCLEYPFGMQKDGSFIYINENEIESVVLMGNINY